MTTFHLIQVPPEILQRVCDPHYPLLQAVPASESNMSFPSERNFPNHHPLPSKTCLGALIQVSWV